MDIAIDANNVVIKNIHWSDVMELVEDHESEQFTAVSDENRNRYTVTMPINKVIAEKYRAQIHQARAKNLLTKDRSKSYTTDPDDKPPTPTNPRGSGGKVVEFQNTMAVAA